MDDDYGSGETDEREARAEFPRDAKPWLDLISDGEKCFASYNERSDNIDKLYASLAKLAQEKVDREFQMFWANMEVLRPTIYSRTPVPVVIPRFRERKEATTRTAEILERSLIASFELESIDDALRDCRDDLAILSRGAPWVRYEADEDENGEMISEKVCYDHVDRHDFLHEPARKWKEVGWVARRSFLTLEQGKERFGDIFLRTTREEIKGADDSKYGGEKKAKVWEIWSKTEQAVVWVSPGLDEILDAQDPFLQLDGFFPCPKPAYGTVQRASMIPIPDFLYYKDQVEEINELTARISALSESLKVKGFYAAGADDLSGAIESAMKQSDQGATLVPVSSAAMMTGGKLEDSIVWFPVQNIAMVIKELIETRKQLIQDVYEITGLSDIMRGQTAASETLGAQQLKSQYGSIRVRERQSEIVRLARDMTRIAGEIMAENFSPKTLLDMSQVDLPTREQIQQQVQQMAQQHQMKRMQAGEQGQEDIGPFQPPKPPTTVEDVMELLQEQRMRPFILEIETDSTIQPDENAEKQRRTEFLTAIGSFISQAFPLVQALPQAAPMAAESLKFAAGGFRAGRQLETVIDEFADSIKGIGQEQKPDPAEAQAQQQMQMEQQRGQVEMAMKQLDLEIKKIEFQGKQTEAQAEMQRLGAEGEGDGAAPLEQEETIAKINLIVAQADKIRAEIEEMGVSGEIKAAETMHKINQPVPYSNGGLS